jgi:hypothetical protein
MCNLYTNTYTEDSSEFENEHWVQSKKRTLFEHSELQEFKLSAASVNCTVRSYLARMTPNEDVQRRNSCRQEISKQAAGSQQAASRRLTRSASRKQESYRGTQKTGIRRAQDGGTQADSIQIG